jgi:hypothetical protein
MQPVPTHDPVMDRGWGVTGFDREIGVCLRVAESDEFLKTSKLLSATKTARGILSPIQVADLQPAYALVA